jgi:hypothetical protein
MPSRSAQPRSDLEDRTGGANTGSPNSMIDGCCALIMQLIKWCQFIDGQRSLIFFPHLSKFSEYPINVMVELHALDIGIDPV